MSLYCLSASIFAAVFRLLSPFPAGRPADRLSTSGLARDARGAVFALPASSGGALRPDTGPKETDRCIGLTPLSTAASRASRSRDPRSTLVGVGLAAAPCRPSCTSLPPCGAPRRQAPTSWFRGCCSLAPRALPCGCRCCCCPGLWRANSWLCGCCCFADAPRPGRDRVRGACFFTGRSCAGLAGLEARFSGLLAPGWSSVSIAMEPCARPPREKDAHRAPTAAGRRSQNSCTFQCTPFNGRRLRLNTIDDFPMTLSTAPGRNGQSEQVGRTLRLFYAHAVINKS